MWKVQDRMKMAEKEEKEEGLEEKEEKEEGLEVEVREEAKVEGLEEKEAKEAGLVEMEEEGEEAQRPQAQQIAMGLNVWVKNF